MRDSLEKIRKFYPDEDLLLVVLFNEYNTTEDKETKEVIAKEIATVYNDNKETNGFLETRYNVYKKAIEEIVSKVEA